MKYDKRVFFLIEQIKQNNELLMSQDCLDIIYYIVYKSFKLRYLARILHNIMIEKKQKLLIFIKKLMSLWQTEVFLDNLDMNVKVICSQMNQKMRAIIINWFNNFNNRYQIFLTTFFCAASELNLYKMCYNVVIMKILFNINTFFQVINCVHWLEQLFL